MSKDSRTIFGTVVVAITNPLVRKAMVDEIRRRGADDVIAVVEHFVLEELLGNTMVDLLIMDDILSEIETASLTRDIRNGALHAHPFPLILVLAHDQKERDLHEVIDSGPDAILLYPVSIAELSAKIEILAARRKPFIIVRGYIGPDRRKAPREGPNQPRSIEAPNPLAGNGDPELFQQAIAKSMQDLSVAKMGSSIDQLAHALKTGNAADFTGLIPAVEHLAEAAPKPALREAAENLAAALRSRNMEEIMRAARALLAAA